MYKKITDEEAIEALKICLSKKLGCENCPLEEDNSNCAAKLKRKSYEIITRQQQIIEQTRLPCKIGDKVYALNNYKGNIKIYSGIVSEMFYVGKEMKLCIVVKNCIRGYWGENVFATHEEAEERMKKLKCQ